MESERDLTLTDTELREIQTAISVVAPPGREEQAIGCVRDMISRRGRLEVLQDRFGNLIVRFRRERGGQPLFFCAHLDHPGLVAVKVDGEEIRAEYRGGSATICRVGSTVNFYGANRTSNAVITSVDTQTIVSPILMLNGKDTVEVGDVGVITTEVTSLACDDMAGVCACIHALDRIDQNALAGPVRLLFTRAEEIGMIGAIGACRSGLIPAASRLIVVDARSDTNDDRIHVSARDRSGPVNPRLVNECVRLGCALNEELPTTTEAGVYGAFGFDSAAVTYPISFMHNEREGEPAAERIKPGVYERLVTKVHSLMLHVSHQSTRETLVRHFDRNITTIE